MNNLSEPKSIAANDHWPSKACSSDYEIHVLQPIVPFTLKYIGGNWDAGRCEEKHDLTLIKKKTKFSSYTYKEIHD